MLQLHDNRRRSKFQISYVAGPDKLPSLGDIIKTVKAPKKFLLGKCELDVKIDNKKITIDVAFDNCQINLKEIIDHFFPSNNLDEETKSFLISQIVFVKLEIDTEKKTVEFEAKSPTKVDLIYDKVFKAEWSISDRFLNIKFSYEKTFNYENIGVKLSGKLGIGKQDILLEFEKKEGEKKMSFKANTGNVDIRLSVKDLVGVIGLEEKIKEMFGEETLQKNIVDFAMESISFEGVFDPTTYDIELVVSGAVKTDLAKKAKFYFVVIKMQGEPYKIAVVGKVESVEFQKLIDMVVGKKTEIELLKDKSLNAIIMAASDNILVLQNKDLVDVIKDVPKEENAAIPKGPTIVLDFGTAIEDESKSKEKRKQLYMRYVDKKFTFKFIPNLEIELLDTLQMFVKKSVKTELPKWLGEISGKIRFEKFAYDIAGSLNLQILVPGQLTIGSLLTITDVKIQVLRKAGQDMWDFSIESLTQITKDVSLEIGIEKIKGAYELKGKIPKISLKELLKYFVSNDKFASGEFERFNLDLKAVNIRWILPESKPTALKYVFTNLMLCYVMLCYVMLCYVMLCYVMLCYVMLCYVMLCYVMLCYVMLCYVMLCYVMLCYVMLCYVMLCYVMLCYVMLCYVMLCYVMLCYVMLCYVMLCYVMLCYVILCYVMLCYVMLCYVMLCYVMFAQFLA